MNDQNNENNPVATDEAATITQQASTEQTVETKSKKPAAKAAPVKVLTAFQKLDFVRNQQLKSNIPQFRVGDTLKVHVRIVEGNKERIQVFEGLVIKRNGGLTSEATFTVRKVSYNVGVERTFLVHSPRVEKIEVMTHGVVRRARLFYLRPLRGKAARIKTKFMNKTPETVDNSSVVASTEAAA